MRMTRRASHILFCLGILLIIGACSAAGGSPIDPGDNNPEPDKFASSIEGIVYKGGGPVSGSNVYIYNIDSLELHNSTVAGQNGEFTIGVDDGQYLMFAFGQSGWHAPELESDISSYVNVEAGQQYRLDIDLTDNLPAGDELIFGFVTSAENELPIGNATVSGGGRSTMSDAYGFYALTVPAGTGVFTITADGFFNTNVNIREGQAGDDYFSTPFFNLNPKDTAGATILGVVRDVADGTGLGGVRVTLTLPADISYAPQTFLTNLGGEYKFHNLKEAIYRLNFERPGYYSVPRDGLIIKDQDDVIINVFLHRDETSTARVWGYVNNAGLPLPISGARVSASNPLLGSILAYTNPTGFYELTGLVPANYTFTVVAPGAGVSFYEAASTFQTVFPGDNKFDFALRFIDEGVLRGNITINGQAYDEAYPPQGVEMTAEKIGGQMSGVKFRTTTDYLGKYTYNGIPMGFYKVVGRAEYSSTEVYIGTAFNVVVNPGETTVADLDLTLN